jgi:hypothetical protein
MRITGRSLNSAQPRSDRLRAAVRCGAALSRLSRIGGRWLTHERSLQPPLGWSWGLAALCGRGLIWSGRLGTISANTSSEQAVYDMCRIS